MAATATTMCGMHTRWAPKLTEEWEQMDGVFLCEAS